MPGLRDLARAAGCSVATASRAMRSDPLVTAETRALVWAAADRIGYRSNPYIGRMLSSVRKGESATYHGNLAILWFDESPDRLRHPDWLTLREAAHLRARELGYGIDEFVRPEFTSRRLEKILKSRGIRGILVSPPSYPSGKTRLRLELEECACVLLGWGILHPAQHRVAFDHDAGLKVALHHARHRFGKAVAAAWDSRTDRRAGHSLRARFLSDFAGGVELAEKRILDSSLLSRAEAADLLRTEKIECLILECPVPMAPPVRKLFGKDRLIYLNNPDHQACFGQVSQRHDLLASWGIDILARLAERREYGTPDPPMTVLVPPRWHSSVSGL